MRLHKVFELSWVYSALISLSGAEAGRPDFIKNSLRIAPGNRVMEIGCGPGTNMEHMPEGTVYTGCDNNPRYIDFAVRKYAGRGTFLCFSVDDLPGKELGEFDIVLVIHVLHHLTDDQVRAVANSAHKMLRKGGVLLVSEPCWTERQGWLDRFMLSIDRGRHVRTAEGYARLIEGAFSGVEREFLMTPKLLWPQSGCILRARKS